MNQGIQHPLASAYMHLEAAKLATYHAARLYDQSAHDDSITTGAVGVACNSAKYVAAEAAFTACERSVLSMGGMGYAAEYHVERYLRECFVPRIAPVSRVSFKCDERRDCAAVRMAELTLMTGNDHELCGGESAGITAQLLNISTYLGLQYFRRHDLVLEC